ncbi:MAG: hypothetical protein E6K68_00680 [Nitrospirae bacterium]|nr:MAG: hypothetical protein E6K68_00680 [Nitrospirota bacterium]
MRRAVFLGLIGSLLTMAPAWALEFTADLITHANGKTHASNLYYRDDRWRLEHQDNAPVNVTIVRKDKQVTWLLISSLKHYKEVPYDASQAPKVQEKLEGEVSRSVVGTEILDGHPTTLFEVHAQEGTTIVDYYQWLATDIHFPLKLVRKDGSWSVEYRRVRMGHVSDFLFQLPVNFPPLEEFDGLDRLERDQARPKTKM